MIDKARVYFGLSDLEKQTQAGGVLNIHIGDAFSPMVNISGGYAGKILVFMAIGIFLFSLLFFFFCYLFTQLTFYFFGLVFDKIFRFVIVYYVLCFKSFLFTSIVCYLPNKLTERKAGFNVAVQT